MVITSLLQVEASQMEMGPVEASQMEEPVVEIPRVEMEPTLGLKSKMVQQNMLHSTYFCSQFCL